MSLRLALLFSLALHTALILAPQWTPRAIGERQPTIEVRLLMPDEATLQAAEVTSQQIHNQTSSPRSAEPQRLEGAPLRQAQAALSRTLFYPPEAVTRGQEGEVILLLTLSESNQLTRVEIARSSGHPLLDQAALDAARQIGSLPGTKRQLLFPISFRLQ